MKNILYKIAHGHRVTEQTLLKHGLPQDLNPLHPMVMNRKNSTTGGEARVPLTSQPN